MIRHSRMSQAHNGLGAGSSPAGSSPLKSPSPVHDLTARNVGFSPNNGPSACRGHVGFVPILLQKSFWGDERKFLKPPRRFTRGGVRDHIVSSRIDHGSP